MAVINPGHCFWTPFYLGKRVHNGQLSLLYYNYPTCVCAARSKAIDSICPSISTKFARSQAIGICACCKHNQLVKKLVSTRFELNCLLAVATNRAFPVQHACGLSTTPTPLAYADVTVHARAQRRKGSASHNNSSSTLRYRVRGIRALESSS